MDAPYELLSEPTREARFWSNVDRGEPNECWVWRRALNGSGYGVNRCGSGGESFTTMAHRVAWILANKQPIPEGQVLDHLCRNRTCCNPAHVRLTDMRGNTRSGRRHKAGDAPVVRLGPKTLRVKTGGRVMVIWREYLADGKVRQTGKTYPSHEAAAEAVYASTD